MHGVYVEVSVVRHSSLLMHSFLHVVTTIFVVYYSLSIDPINITRVTQGAMERAKAFKSIVHV